MSGSDRPIIRLGEIAHARSGDKGDRANIGVVVDRSSDYDHVRAHLTAEAVAEFLGPMGIGRVVRYDLPKIRALNFVIEKALGGGASRSLRLDTQGKSLGTVLLECPIPSPEDPRDVA